MTDIDTANKFFVDEDGLVVRVHIPPRTMTREEAMVFAAWVTFIAESLPGDVTFDDARAAVRAS